MPKRAIASQQIDHQPVRLEAHLRAEQQISQFARNAQPIGMQFAKMRPVSDVGGRSSEALLADIFSWEIGRGVPNVVGRWNRRARNGFLFVVTHFISRRIAGRQNACFSRDYLPGYRKFLVCVLRLCRRLYIAEKVARRLARREPGASSPICTSEITTAAMSCHAR